MPRDEALAALRELPGVGEFTAEAVWLRGCGVVDELPSSEETESRCGARHVRPADLTRDGFDGHRRRRGDHSGCGRRCCCALGWNRELGPRSYPPERLAGSAASCLPAALCRSGRPSTLSMMHWLPDRYAVWPSPSRVSRTPWSSVCASSWAHEQRRGRIARRAHNEDRWRAWRRVVGRRQSRVRRPIAATTVGGAKDDVAEDGRVGGELRFRDLGRASSDLLVKAVDRLVGLHLVVDVFAARAPQILVGQRQERLAITGEAPSERSTAAARSRCRTWSGSFRRSPVTVSAAVLDRRWEAGSCRRRRATGAATCPRRSHWSRVGSSSARRSPRCTSRPRSESPASGPRSPRWC